MRYKVVFDKTDRPARHVPRPKKIDREISIRSGTSGLQQRNMIMLENPDSGFVERKNAINKIVNAESAESRINNPNRENFQYPAPRVRASFTVRVAADLPQPTATNERANSADNPKESASIKVGIKKELKLPKDNPIPPYDPESPEYGPKSCEYGPQYRQKGPVEPAMINVPKYNRSVPARSTTQVSSDDKEFEIPLEESLKAVEEFIKREKELSKWKVGEDVLAKWKGNGLYYKAKILEIFISGLVVIVFDTYDVTDEIDYRDLCKYFKKTNNYKKKGGHKKDLLKLDNEPKNEIVAKKEIKIKKKNKKLLKKIRPPSVVKKAERFKRKRLLAFAKRTKMMSSKIPVNKNPSGADDK